MEIARHWRLKQQRYQMIGDIDEFGKPRFPPRETRIQFSQSPRQEPQQRGGGGSRISIYVATGVPMSSK